jgi:hypothetical protein
MEARATTPLIALAAHGKTTSALCGYAMFNGLPFVTRAR